MNGIKSITTNKVCCPVAIGLSLLLALVGCTESPTGEAKPVVNWQERATRIPEDSLQAGATYLSVYSQIYSQSEHRTFNLTVTVSLRNTNTADTVYIQSVDYYDTSGEAIRKYIRQPVFIAPMETVEIVIAEDDLQGGTGGNFYFDWLTPAGSQPPYFEAVMISTYGSQGLSFSTQGHPVGTPRKHP
ncbi:MULTISPECIES: DUF3124 domain-containing protein [Robiginitalea]|uniref:DUF3124 domain-containing protein n=1 Tax=Robiginitalea TaxID=252306 RepID=UPI0002F9FF7C|nr:MULTISPECIES: DUF3124 domain-containing protein [Robiginitalea]MDC6354555.1 DUF3124 domain-containing protein [Robiginitalea sp. PM2]MDC6374763.1 DUF3124 domain-containing protein [Robiginitalea sp. SP8]